MSQVPRTITANLHGSPNLVNAQSGNLPFRDKTHESANVDSYSHSPTLHKCQIINQQHDHQYDHDITRSQFNRFSSVNALHNGDSYIGDQLDKRRSPRTTSSTNSTVTATTTKISNTHQHPRALSSPRHNSNNNTNNHYFTDKNNDENNENINNDKDTIFQLQLEIESLRQRLKIIDTSKSGSTSKEELLDLIDEKESIIQTKSDQVNVLSDKFQKITLAVSRMESDTSSIRGRNKTLEDENKKIQRHLAIREKEVSVLVSRCAAQEEKNMGVKECKVLEREIQELRTEIMAKERDDEAVDEELHSLKEWSARLEKDRGLALEKVEKVTKKFDGEVEKMQRTIFQLESKSASEKEDIIKVETEFERVRQLRDTEKKRRAVDETNQKRLQKEAIDEIQMQLDIQREESDNFYAEAKIKMEAERDKERAYFQSQLILQKEQSNDFYAEAAREIETEHHNELEHHQSQLNSKDEQITNLLKDAAERNDANRNLTSKIIEAVERIDELTSKNEDDANKFDTIRKELENEVETKSHEIVQLNSSIQQLNSSVQQLEDRTKSCDKGNTQLKDKNNELKDRAAHLEVCVTQQEKSLKQEAMASSNQISQLRQDVKKLKDNELDQDEEIKTYKNKVSRLDQAINECSEENTVIRKALMSEKIEVDKASAELEKTKLRLQTQKELNAIELERLKQSIKIFKTHNQDKDEEIQNKEGALKKANDKVVELEEKLTMLQGHMERTEMEAAEIVNELTGDIEVNKIQETKKAGEVKELKGTIETLERKHQFAELESTKSMDRISSYKTELEASRINIDSLSKLRAEQEEKHQSLCSELEMLIGAYDRSKIESSRKVVALQNEVNERKARSENEATKFQTDYSKLQELANRAEERADKNAGQLEKEQKELDEKIRIMNDMAEHSERSQKDQGELRKLVTELQEENESFLEETVLLKTKCLQLEKEITKKGDDHFNVLQKEVSIRQGMDSTVTRLRVEIQGMKNQCEDYTELEAKNFLLQDKVERQENYLKKRLHEQSRKNQVFGKTPSPMRPSMGTPTRSNKGKLRDPSPSRHSLSQRIPPIPKSSHSKLARRSMGGLKSTASKGKDELDLLLGDV